MCAMQGNIIRNIKKVKTMFPKRSQKVFCVRSIHYNVNLSTYRLLPGCCLVPVYILALIRALESTSGYQLKSV